MVLPRTTVHRDGMRRETSARRRTGSSLLELLVTLLLITLLVTGAATALRRGIETYAARAARDSMAALVARTRALALSNAGARLVVDPASATAWVEAPVGSPAGEPLRLGDIFQVTLTVDQHTGGLVSIDFDALAIGRVASRTFRVRRGEAEARLTLSSYGRPRRW